jgi:hypothetical protein
MMPSSTKRSLDSLTREDILRVCEKYRDNKPELRRILRAIFKRRENIHLFGWFISKEYIELETPDFHREILREASDERNSRMAFCAPRGHAKSTTVNFTYALWATVHDQVRFGLMISDTVTQSVEFVNALRDEIESNVRMRWLYGDLTGTIIWRDGDIKTSSGVRWVAKGAGMKIRGIRDGSARPDLIIFDDLENDEQGKTVARPQNQLAEAIPHFEDMDGGDIYTSPYESEERNILELLIRYGQTLMYYANDDQKTPVTVAAYITEELENDDIAFQNPLHQLIYEEYKAHAMDENFVADRYFLYHSDARISQLTADLITEKYTLSKVHSKVKKVESDSERLIELIPRVIFEYKNSLIIARIRQKLLEMKAASDNKNNLRVDEIMREMAELEGVKRQLSKTLGERIIIKI